MPGEVKNAEQDKAIADPVAPLQDIDLDSAALEAERRLEGEVPDATPAKEEKPADADPVVEEDKESVAEPPKEDDAAPPATPDEPPDEPTEHKERTKLGRKVAELESNIGKLLEQNTILLQRLTEPQAPPAPEPQYVGDVSHVPLDQLSDEQVQQRYDELHAESPYKANRFLKDAEMARESSVKLKYALGYNAQVDGWVEKAVKEEDPDVTEIHKLLIGDTPFNVRRSSDPKADFDYNLSKAEAHYYKTKAKTPTPAAKPPLQNATPRAPLAVGGEGKADAPGGTPKPLKISPAAMEFAKAQGWTDEQVAAALSAPLPNSFVKGRR